MARLFIYGQAVMNMLPILWCSVSRIDAERFAAWTHIRDSLVTFAWSHRSHNVDAGDGRAVVVGGPADESEDASRDERNDAPVAVENRFLSDPAEPNPVLNALLE